MAVRRVRKGLLFCGALSLVPLAACGDDAAKSIDIGQLQTPDGGGFNGGNNNSSGGYGSGTKPVVDAGPPVCSDAYKTCAQEFTYPVGSETSVELRGDYRGDSWAKGDALTKSGSLWKVTVQVPYNKQVQYKFLINGTTWVLDPVNTKSVTEPNGNKNSAVDPITCKDFVCVEPVLPPDVFDWRDAVIYFPMVDRFMDGDGQNPCRVTDSRVADLANFKGGDWAGITQKITDGYFDALGVNTIWLSVPVENAIGPDEGANQDAGKWFTGYHAYWPKDLNPKTPYHCFGTATDLKALMAAAHAKKMKVIADYAMVHVHKTSPLFNDHKDWFWTNGSGGAYSICAGAGWDVFSNSGSGWYWDANKEGNKCWFTTMLAHWNFGNAAARKYVVDNVIDWVKEYGLDGLRLDAIKHVDMQWLKDLRARLNSDIMPTKKAGERFYLLGETYDGDPNKLKVHVDPATMLDGQFDFALKPNVVDAMLSRSQPMSNLANAVATSEGFYGTGVVMSTFVGNHDQPRSIGSAGGEGNAQAYERMANAFSVLLTVKGAPSILYGDEIGMPGGADPDNRRMMTFTGLSADQTKLRDRIGKMAKIRADHPALRRGTRQTLRADNDVWVFSMTAGADVVYVAINRGDSDQSVGGLPNGSLKELVTGATVNGPSQTVPARQTRVFTP